MIHRSFLLAALWCGHAAIAQDQRKLVTNLPDGTQRYTVERTVPVEFLGVTQPFILWDSTAQFRNDLVRGENGWLIPKDEEPGAKAKRLHRPVNPAALPQGDDPAWQKAKPLHGTNKALDLSVDGLLYTSVNPADPCMDVGPNHVILMINGGSGAYFRIYDKSFTALGAQTYLDNFTASVGGAGDPIVQYDALADRWLMSEFSASGNRLLVAISQTNNPLGSWYAYSYQATNFPDYPKYGVWTDCYTVTTNETTPAIYVLPKANMLAGTTGTAVRFSVSSYGTIGFQATTPVTFDGGTAPPTGAPAMFMRMADDAWGAPADRLEIWNINYNATTPASSTITGPALLSTDPFDSGLCGYTSFNCMNQPGSTTTLDPLREVLMNKVHYRNLPAGETIVCDHVTDVNNTDRGGIRWYELRRTGGIANPWSIRQQGTYSPDANDRWMAGIAINNNGDIALAYSVSGTTGGNVYPSLRYTGRYANDPLGQMTIAETSIVAGTAANASNRWGDYFSLDVDPADGVSFFGTGCYNPATSWRTRMFKFSFAPLGCTAPSVSQTVTDNCGAGTFSVGITIGANGDAPNYDIYTSVNGGAFTFVANQVPGAYTVGTYAFGTSVVVQVRHTVNAACNQQLAAVTSNGTSCCTAPVATLTANCNGTSQYTTTVNLTSMGSATSIAIQIDPDAGGPATATTVQTVTAPGVYGPFGPYASASLINVVLVHNVYAQCSLAFNNYTKDCNSPGATCGAFSSSTVVNITDNTTATSTITVPSQSGATITDLNVYVNITHTYISDLRLTLTSPQGTAVALVNTGACGSNQNMNVEFDQTGANGAVGATCPLNNLFVVPSVSLAGFNGQLFQGTWTLSVQDVATQDQGTLNSWCLLPTLSSPSVRVTPRVVLEGPYSTSTGLMTDALRSASLIPTTEPYTGLGYAHVGGGGGETVSSAVLATTGNNAIVDWVLVELRNSANSAQVLASRCALLQRDGDVVDVDGTSGVLFNGRPPGNYFVAVRHRNHLGVMTAAAVALTGTTSTVDLTLSATAVYGTEARKALTGTFPAQAMWAGDVTFNRTVQYTGSGNDRDPILARIGGTVPTSTVAGYFNEDVNLSGVVQYTGGGNDRDPILVNIGGTVPTNTRTEQLP
ncbi:MAG: proprotein convertase P-domain-containing protein [Flavobacteriales bacterium]|nr:proprotein convertase P-domain-containing protein [Flavobacteriales bacterium]